MKIKFLTPLLFLCFSTMAQDFLVEYDKNHDFSQYKTFSFGESEIITPKDEETIDENKIHSWVKKAMIDELEAKGLKNVESNDSKKIKTFY